MITNHNLSILTLFATCANISIFPLNHTVQGKTWTLIYFNSFCATLLLLMLPWHLKHFLSLYGHCLTVTPILCHSASSLFFGPSQMMCAIILKFSTRTCICIILSLSHRGLMIDREMHLVFFALIWPPLPMTFCWHVRNYLFTNVYHIVPTGYDCTKRKGHCAHKGRAQYLGRGEASLHRGPHLCLPDRRQTLPDSGVPQRSVQSSTHTFMDIHQITFK